MQRFRKILVYINPSNDHDAPISLLRAVKLARNTGAEIHVVGILPQPKNSVYSWMGYDEAAIEVATRRLENRISTLCEDNASELDYTYAVRQGRPFVELIQEAHTTHCDLIVKEAKSDGDVSFFSTGDLRLMRNAPMPVWMVKTNPVTFYERVLVAIDPFASSDEETETNYRLLELASSLADWEKGNLYVVAACEIRGAELLITGMTPGQFEDHVRELVVNGQKSLMKILERLAEPIPKNRIEYQEGQPASVIVDYAEKIDADIVVMGTLTESTIESMLMGNTAADVLRRVRNSVLTIKPKGFDSPVTTP